MSELEASAVEKHPLIFSILFLVTLLPAIKFLGLQGLPWTKVWAGIYLCSYVVLAIVRALASKDWRDRPPRVAPLGENTLFTEKLLGIIRIVLLVVASLVHASVSCWALSMDYEYGWIDEGSSDLQIFGIIQMQSFILMNTSFLGLLFLLPWVLYFHFIGINLTWISITEQITQRFIIGFLLRVGETNVITVKILFFYFLKVLLYVFIHSAVMFCILYFLFVPAPLTTISTIIFKGGSNLTLFFGLLFLLFTIMSAISKRVGFLSFLKFDDGDYKALLAFPFLNFLVALLYYRYLYDPTGTVKPSWTENLG